jgi:hypothetical protein
MHEQTHLEKTLEDMSLGSLMGNDFDAIITLVDRPGKDAELRTQSHYIASGKDATEMSQSYYITSTRAQQNKQRCSPSTFS